MEKNQPKEYNFKIQSQTIVPRQNFNERVNGDYIKYGDDNRFPYKLIQYQNQSSIHATCLQAVIESIVGNGLVSSKEELLEGRNSVGDTLNDVFAKISNDYYLFGGYAVEVIPSNDKSAITLYHIPFHYLRASEKDFRGQIKGYYLSADWGKVGINEYKDNYLPSFDASKSQANSIYVKKKYRAGNEYYPLPSYVGALHILELDIQVDNYHVNNMKNGLKPSLSITTFTGGKAEQLKVIEKQLNDNYGGAENAGALIYMDVQEPAKAPKIEPIQQNGSDKYYIEVNNMSTQKILTSHRITSPMLLGIKDNVGLGNNSEELQTAYDLFMNMVIAPFQAQILSGLEFLFNSVDKDVVLGVENIIIFPKDGEADTEVITSTDSEVGEDAQLENQDIADKIIPKV